MARRLGRYELEEEDIKDPGCGTGDDVKAGVRLRAHDSHGRWYQSRVEAVRGEGASRELLVHYYGWAKDWDEWVPVGAGRLDWL